MIKQTLIALALSKSLLLAAEFSICTSEYPPFEYMNKGKLTGTDVEKVRKIAAAMQMEANIFISPWKRCELMAEQGAVEAIMSLSQNKRREAFLHFSKPISQIRDVFFKRKTDSISWKELKDLSPYRIGVSGGYNYDSSFENARKNGTLKMVDSVRSGTPEYQNLNKLIRNRIDLFICEINACMYIINSHPDTLRGLDHIDKSIGPVRTFHVGFSKKHAQGKALQEAFNKAMKKLGI